MVPGAGAPLAINGLAYPQQPLYNMPPLGMPQVPSLDLVSMQQAYFQQLANILNL